MVLALWVLSPCLLLYARMARSYSMQLAVALLTIYAAFKWIERPQSGRWLLATAALRSRFYMSRSSMDNRSNKND